MYPVYRLLGKEELLHGTYGSYHKAMREAVYLVRSGLSKCAKVQTATEIKTVVMGKNKTLYICGKAVK
jgi:hypothetical protein